MTGDENIGSFRIGCSCSSASLKAAAQRHGCLATKLLGLAARNGSLRLLVAVAKRGRRVREPGRRTAPSDKYDSNKMALSKVLCFLRQPRTVQ